MRVLIIGMGNIGKALATRLRAAGQQVTGTTTSPQKVEALSAFADDIKVLRGSETDKIRAAAEGCDAIIVTAAPDVRRTRTREEREAHYADTLEATCRSAAAAADRVLFLSSFSVYGDGGPGNAPITEDTPVSNQDEPSAKYYHRSEQAILSRAGGCVLRFPDMHGAPGDLGFADRVKLAHDYFGGKTVFSPDAPLYVIHFEDVVDAVMHALDAGLRGVYNVCDDERIPPSNKIAFDRICESAGLPRLEFLSHIKAPERRISAGKIYATGYRVKHAPPDFLLTSN